jgi:hypothetical protein
MRMRELDGTRRGRIAEHGVCVHRQVRPAQQPDVAGPSATHARISRMPPELDK